MCLFEAYDILSEVAERLRWDRNEGDVLLGIGTGAREGSLQQCIEVI